ncbi:MAG: Zn-ribbon domain-containing OB-fold protein [Pseudomonadota bacterium]
MQRTQPTRSALSEPWFDACNEGRLLLQKCSSCGAYQFYPRILCTHCGARDPQWVEASGAGRIASFTVVRRAVSKAYEAPYVVALVDLEEGPRLMTNIVDCAPEAVRIGARVGVRFDSWGDDVDLPVFTLNTADTRSDDSEPKEDVTP